MEKRAYALIGLIAAVGVVGIVETSEAQPEGSLGGGVFLVLVEQVAGVPIEPVPFVNCYVFDPNGPWFETERATQGFWTQDSFGDSATYRTVDALAAGFFPVEQVGQITTLRLGGGGIRQLVANTTVDLSAVGVGELEFLSVGFEIDPNSAQAEACPGLAEAE